MDSFTQSVRSTRARSVLHFLGVLLVLLLIFHAGFALGSHRHSMSLRMHDEHFRGPALGGIAMPHGYIGGGHGAVGTIQSVATSSLVMESRDGSLTHVLISHETTVRSAMGDSSTTVLRAGQQAVVLGTPNSDETISAQFIHIIPTGGFGTTTR